MIKTINIVSRSNGVGLDRDVDLLRSSLESKGFETSFSEHRKLYSTWRTLQRQKKYDVNIFIERVFPCWLGQAKKNILIPNQERFPRRHIGRLNRIDAVFAKTQHAFTTFKELHNDCRFTSFTSRDANLPSVRPDYSRFLHLAGRSTVKGTEDILALWSRHPEWPELTLVQNSKNPPKDLPQNVKLYSERLPDPELGELLNFNGIHLCPSRCEGWGHYIVEAMSCAAVVVTTDGAPMNELVDSERGVLVTTCESSPRHLGTSYMIDITALEGAIQQLIDMPLHEKQAMGACAREWFLKQDDDFHKVLANELLSITV